MIVQLVSNMTDKQLLARIDQLEAHEKNLLEKTHYPKDRYHRRILIHKRTLTLQLYVEAIYEAAYRNLLVIH